MKRPLLFFLLFSAGCANCSKSNPDGAAADTGTTSAAVSASPSATGFSVEACEQVLIMAERELADVRHRVPKACSTDADCVLAESTACIPGCSDFAMSKSELAQYNASVAKTRSSKCKMWNGNGCPETTPKPKPECPPKTAKCEDAKCVAR